MPQIDNAQRELLAAGSLTVIGSFYIAVFSMSILIGNIPQISIVFFYCTHSA